MFSFMGKKESEFIKINLSKEEKNIIEKLAKLHKQEPEEFVRWVLLNKFLNEYLKIS